MKDEKLDKIFQEASQSIDFGDGANGWASMKSKLMKEGLITPEERNGRGFRWWSLLLILLLITGVGLIWNFADLNIWGLENPAGTNQLEVINNEILEKEVSNEEFDHSHSEGSTFLEEYNSYENMILSNIDQDESEALKGTATEYKKNRPESQSVENKTVIWSETTKVGANPELSLAETNNNDSGSRLYSDTITSGNVDVETDLGNSILIESVKKEHEAVTTEAEQKSSEKLVDSGPQLMTTLTKKNTLTISQKSSLNVSSLSEEEKNNEMLQKPMSSNNIPINRLNKNSKREEGNSLVDDMSSKPDSVDFTDDQILLSNQTKKKGILVDHVNGYSNRLKEVRGEEIQKEKDINGENIATLPSAEDKKIALLEGKEFVPLDIKSTIFSPTLEKDKLVDIQSKLETDSEISARRSNWSFGIEFSPDLSGTGFGKVEDSGFNLGLNIEYHLNSKFSITSGFAYAKKLYFADENIESYNTNPNWILDRVNANCDVIDIPINLNYYVSGREHSGLVFSAGLSTYLMLREDYDILYEQPWPERTLSIRNENDHFLSIFNASVGYKKILSPTLSIQAEPFIKLPLQGIGEGNIDLFTSGLRLTLKYNQIKINQ